MHVRQFVRQNAAKPCALGSTQRWRQEDAPGSGHGGDGGVSEFVRPRVFIVGGVDADRRAAGEGAFLHGFDARQGGGKQRGDLEGAGPRLGLEMNAPVAFQRGQVSWVIEERDEIMAQHRDGGDGDATRRDQRES